MIVMARMPDSDKATLTHRLEAHRAARWPNWSDSTCGSSC